MIIKENVQVLGTYAVIKDLFEGYLKPENYLELQSDIDKVNEAMEVLRMYEKALWEAEAVEEI